MDNLHYHLLKCQSLLQVAINGQCLMQYHLVFPNHACAGNMLCIGGSICIQGVCKCPRGMYGPFICRSRPASLVHANTIVAS